MNFTTKKTEIDQKILLNRLAYLAEMDAQENNNEIVKLIDDICTINPKIDHQLTKELDGINWIERSIFDLCALEGSAELYISNEHVQIVKDIRQTIKDAHKSPNPIDYHPIKTAIALRYEALGCKTITNVAEFSTSNSQQQKEWLNRLKRSIDNCDLKYSVDISIDKNKIKVWFSDNDRDDVRDIINFTPLESSIEKTIPLIPGNKNIEDIKRSEKVKEKSNVGFHA